MKTKLIKLILVWSLSFNPATADSLDGALSNDLGQWRQQIGTLLIDLKNSLKINPVKLTKNYYVQWDLDDSTSKNLTKFGYSDWAVNSLPSKYELENVQEFFSLLTDNAAKYKLLLPEVIKVITTKYSIINSKKILIPQKYEKYVLLLRDKNGFQNTEIQVISYPETEGKFNLNLSAYSIRITDTKTN